VQINPLPLGHRIRIKPPIRCPKLNILLEAVMKLRTENEFLDGVDRWMTWKGPANHVAGGELKFFVVRPVID